MLESYYFNAQGSVKFTARGLKMVSASRASIYNGLCILRPPVQAKKYGLTSKMILKCRDVYI